MFFVCARSRVSTSAPQLLPEACQRSANVERARSSRDYTKDAMVTHRAESREIAKTRGQNRGIPRRTSSVFLLNAERFHARTECRRRQAETLRSACVARHFSTTRG